MVAGPDSSSSATLHKMVAEIKAEADPFWAEWDSIDREEFYHYTSIDAVRNILANRVLWASDVLSMNDTSEFKHAVSIIDDELMGRWNVLPIHLSEYFHPRKLLRLGETWNTFAACFCSERDLLEQWRAYTPDAGGASVGFRIGSLYDLGRESNAFALVKINYSSDELRNATKHICDAALELASSQSLVYHEAEVYWSEVALILLNFAVRFKHPSFRGEREWRTLSLNPSEVPVLLRRNRQGMEVKFIDIGFQPEMVTQITLGPRAEDGAELRLREFLDDNGFQEVNILRSTIPLR
jgi:Protein of unknown function (DUF2971)